MFYSQFGEDKILFDIFHKKTTGLCVEVGANNGIDDSTTFFFESIGWKCILVEPNPSLCQKIRTVRNALLFECAASNQSDVRTLYVVEGAERSDGMSTISADEEVHHNIERHGFVSKPVSVRTMTLDEILMEANITGDVDFISIDVEGHEYEVLEGFSLEKWRPSVMLVEDNSNFENTVVSKYVKKFGYVRFMRTGVNDWYAHKRNTQLVNARSRMSTWWLVVSSRIKTRLRRIPLLMRIKTMLSRHGDR